jgi:beta-1,4-mannosyl-glycoprotein beta-1,4-N-acetylglucosaminyltransferase
MRVFDGVLYNGEADVLECRLWELADTVDVMVIVEGDKTFTGKPRQRADRERFNRWADLIHWVDFDTPRHHNPWTVEKATRDQLLIEFDRLGCQADDVITVSDVDEIWNPQMVNSFAEGWHHALMRNFAFSVHWERPLHQTMIAGTRGKAGDSLDGMRRFSRQHMPMVFGGFHLGWMGGVDWCVQKLTEFSHQEYNVGDTRTMIEACFAEGKFINGEVMNQVEVDSDWPWWIRNNLHPESWRVKR